MENGILLEDLDTKPKIKEEKSAPIESKTEIKQEIDVKTESTDVKSETSDAKPIEKQEDPLVDLFYSEIDDIKTEDFKTTSKEQLARLLRPGSTYFNLNPFEVLQIDPYASIDEIKRKYRKLSIYVHPDKNKDDQERAQIAFEAVNRAYKMLEDESERKKCLEVVDEARIRVDATCEEKRKKLKREAALAAQGNHKKDSKEKETKIEEDDPDKYRHSIYVMTCKLFADIERLKVREMEKKAEEKKRKAEEKTNEESKSKVQKEWDKNYEESRQGRISSWQTFVTKKTSTTSPAASEPAKVAPAAKVTPTVKVTPSSHKAFFRPPKHKPESR